MLSQFLVSVCFTVTALQYALGNGGNSSRLQERFLVDGNTITVTIDSHHAIHTVSDKFVSITLDTGQMKYHLKYFHSRQDQGSHVYEEEVTDLVEQYLPFWRTFYRKRSLSLGLANARSATPGGYNSSRLQERFLVDDNTITVTIDSHHAIHTVSEKFVSVTLDTSHIHHHLENFHSSLKKIRNLAKGLSPAYFRVGGTSADSLSFKSGPSTDFVMDGGELDTLYHFAQDVGWDMIFDLNLLHRHNGEWDSSNAESLMRYAASKGYRFHLELGNEPNLYERKNIHLDPAQIGRDYGKLKHLMNSIHPFNEVKLVGPALTGSFHVDYAQKFLSTGSTYIDAFTIHHYYMNGSKAKAENFLNPGTLDNFQHSISRAKEALSKASKGTKTTWVLETSSAYGGGAHVLSESFLAGFTWLDKLGIAAANGIPVVARQSFVGGRYSLVEDDNPLPDYWLTLLYKRLVGRKVLKVTSSEHNHHFRIYAHCSRDPGHPRSVTFYFQNMLSSEIKLNLEQYTSHYYELYILTAGGDGSLTSKNVKLNGHELHMNGDSLPTLNHVSDRVWPVKVPGHSFGFLVSPHADASACA